MDDITLECQSRLEKSVESLHNEFVLIRTGRASPAILDRVQCDYYGDNPVAEGDCVRLTFPPLTEDSRRDLVKKAKAVSEESKVAIRNVRREYMDFVKEADDMTEDYQKRVQEEIQKVVDEAIAKVDQLLSEKEKDILSI